MQKAEVKMIESAYTGEKFPAEPMETEVTIPGPMGYEGEPEATIPVKVETFQGGDPHYFQIITMPTDDIGYSGQLEELLRQLTEKKMFNKELPTLIEQTDEEMPHTALVVYFRKNIASRWIAIRGISGETEIIINRKHKNWDVIQRTWPEQNGVHIEIPPMNRKK